MFMIILSFLCLSSRILRHRSHRHHDGDRAITVFVDPREKALWESPARTRTTGYDGFELEATIVTWITHYGYACIFVLLMFGIVGLPVPDETLLALSGYLVHAGDLRFFPTLAAAFGGSLCGITISYALGRRFGRTIVVKYGGLFRLSAEKLERTLVWFSRKGKYGLTVGYFFPGVRHVVAVAAGSSGLPYGTFARFAYVGGLLWSSAFVSLGYYTGEEWRSAVSTLAHRIFVIGSVAAFVLLVYLLWRKWRLMPRS
jgi:membrane protein DedA with SNARE-associated domain